MGSGGGGGGGRGEEVAKERRGDKERVAGGDGAVGIDKEDGGRGREGVGVGVVRETSGGVSQNSPMHPSSNFPLPTGLSKLNSLNFIAGCGNFGMFCQQAQCSATASWS